ncbi:MAG: NfeD family protein [Hyphomicrobiaceae bacterium]
MKRDAIRARYRASLAPERRPGLPMWTGALASLMAPWLGAMMIVAGLLGGAFGPLGPLHLVAIGAGLIALDTLLDFWMHKRALAAEPAGVAGLNALGNRLVGAIIQLDRPIVGGRGRVRHADSFWAVEGPDLPSGSHVRVREARGAVLLVEPFDGTN